VMNGAWVKEVSLPGGVESGEREKKLDTISSGVTHSNTNNHHNNNHSKSFHVFLAFSRSLHSRNEPSRWKPLINKKKTFFVVVAFSTEMRSRGG
jgi:hypothetical protein